MREIKFRAWDKTMSYMDYRVRISHFKDVIEVLDSWSTWRELKKDEYTLMQYTGLKDKNGVEIFEGDWIRVETQEKDNGEFPIGYVVRANDKPEMFIALPEQLKETGERQYHLENLYKHYSDEFEVIGNIYENSDLLEEKK